MLDTKWTGRTSTRGQEYSLSNDPLPQTYYKTVDTQKQSASGTKGTQGLLEMLALVLATTRSDEVSHGCSAGLIALLRYVLSFLIIRALFGAQCLQTAGF
jgi:hypothetical protein